MAGQVPVETSHRIRRGYGGGQQPQGTEEGGRHAERKVSTVESKL